MILSIKLFAVAKQAAGRDIVSLELPEPATVADLRVALVAAIPALAPAVRHLKFAVDAEYAADDRALTSTDEIACIPPVSGG